MIQAAQPLVSFEDFLEEEVGRSEKREWLNGLVYDMGGGSYEHSRLAMRIGSALTVALEGRCSVASSDTMVFIRETNLATYPDVSVVCGGADVQKVTRNGRAIGEALLNPRLLVEVLSPKTEAYDRAEKFSHYMRIKSLEEYVLMASSERRVEVFRRPEGGRGHWTVEVGLAGDSVTMCGHTFRVDALYSV